MTTAEITAEVFKREGVRQVFGIPGGPSIPYIEAWRGAGVDFVLTSHEGAAAIMADVTARITGIPGVCHATFGPGAVNLASGVGGALLDRSPLIALTTEVPSKMRGRTTQMGIDHQQLFRPLVKDTFSCDPALAAGMLSGAFRAAAAEVPGPVHIGLPADIAGLKTGRGVADTDSGGFNAGDRNGAAGPAGDIAKALSLLKPARRPVIAAGLTAVRCGASEQLKRFLANAPMPVVLTPMAKGLIENDHPCYSGVLFHALSDRIRPVTGSADLIIGIGYDPVEYNYESWVPDVPLLHFSTTEVDMPGEVKAVQVTGDPDSWFAVLEESGIAGDFLAGRGVEQAMAEIADTFGGLSQNWGPVSVLNTLREALPPDAVLTLDVGSHLHLAGQYWPASTPGRVMMTNGWSTMGFGIPSAIAAKICMPGTDVVAVTGDGGFLMTAGEIMTARRYNIGIKVVVIADRELNLIKVKKSWRNHDPYGTELMEGELFGSDTFLGVPVYGAGSEASMQKAIRSAMRTNGPAIICASVPGDDYRKIIVKQ